MMNLPLKLRKQTEYCVPVGPSFSRAQKINYSVDGTEIMLHLPRHRSGYSSREARQPKPDYNFGSLTFHSYNKDWVVDDSWRHFDIMSRSWGFSGPWFTGVLAELSIGVSLITPAEPKSGVSFFHPRAFEQAVGDFITQQYAKTITFGRPDWIAPVNWKPITGLPCVAVFFDVYPDQVANNAGYVHRYMILPTDDRHMLVLSFRFEQHVNALLDERDKIVDRSTMEKLANDIINSVKVSLSPDAETQKSMALEGLDDISLIKDFAPMKWTTREQDVEWNAHVRMHEELRKIG